MLYINKVTGEVAHDIDRTQFKSNEWLSRWDWDR